MALFYRSCSLDSIFTNIVSKLSQYTIGFVIQRVRLIFAERILLTSSLRCWTPIVSIRILRSTLALPTSTFRYCDLEENIVGDAIVRQNWFACGILNSKKKRNTFIFSALKNLLKLLVHSYYDYEIMISRLSWDGISSLCRQQNAEAIQGMK